MTTLMLNISLVLLAKASFVPNAARVEARNIRLPTRPMLCLNVRWDFVTMPLIVTFTSNDEDTKACFQDFSKRQQQHCELLVVQAQQQI
jgi:hypothetical protein